MRKRPLNQGAAQLGGPRSDRLSGEFPIPSLKMTAVWVRL